MKTCHCDWFNEKLNGQPIARQDLGGRENDGRKKAESWGDAEGK